MINPSVFKAYDVRGLYPSEITEELFHQLGRAFVAYLGPGKYAVTRDMRVSSPSLTKAFIDGAVTQGGTIVDYGLVGTDQMYYAVAADGLDGGAQVTASHNPGEYNGCKMVRKEAFPLSGEAGIKEMKEMILANAIPPAPAKPGAVERGDIMARYVEHVLSFVDEASIKPFKVVLDAGSGVAGIVAPRLFNRLPCKTTRLCFEVDGTFPNHEANPLIESLLLYRRHRRVHCRRLHHCPSRRSIPDQVTGPNRHL
jgi:phosphomannomutase